MITDNKNVPPSQQQQPFQAMDKMTQWRMKFMTARSTIGMVIGGIVFIVFCIQIYKNQGFDGLVQAIISRFGGGAF